MVTIINELAAKVRLKLYLASKMDVVENKVFITQIKYAEGSTIATKSYRIDYEVSSNSKTESHVASVNIENGDVCIIY